MQPTASERDALFKTFGRAWFRRDADMLYEAVTENFVWAFSDGNGAASKVTGRAAVAQALAATAVPGLKRSFQDVVYHHAADATFMTFRIVEVTEATGAVREEVGVERYLFRDGRIALKDVYRKRA